MDVMNAEEDMVLIMDCETASAWVQADCGLRSVVLPELLDMHCAYVLNSITVSKRLLEKFNRALIGLQPGIEAIVHRFALLLVTSVLQIFLHAFYIFERPLCIFLQI